MRVAQYKLPKVEGDKADAPLVLYYFGSKPEGTPRANIDLPLIVYFLSRGLWFS
jgi:hypothetical protein